MNWNICKSCNLPVGDFLDMDRMMQWKAFTSHGHQIKSKDFASNNRKPGVVVSGSFFFTRTGKKMQC